MADKNVIMYKDAYNFGVTCCEMIGIKKEEADIFIEILLDADLKGYYTHGMVRLPEYIERIQNSGMNKSTLMNVEHEWDWGIKLNANNGIGHVAAYKGMKAAINKAKRIGIGISTVKMSNHFGIGSFYSELASNQGLIGFVSSNTSSLMAAWGGSTLVLGNNPFSISIPSQNFPITLDIANSIAARSKLYEAARKNQSIPNDWALDEHGDPTIDPSKAIKGSLQPFGKHKGYSLAIVMDILSGILSDSNVSSNVPSKYNYNVSRNIGHFFGVMDISYFGNEQALMDNLEDFINILKSENHKTKSENIRMPGERAYFNRKENLENGITYSSDIIEVFKQLSNKFNVSI